MALLDLFSDHKSSALKKVTSEGENLLFDCARQGSETLFAYLMRETQDYAEARATQNYEGRTIEHIVCMTKQLELVDEIDPRPDTPDFYGNLPIYYSLEQNDLPMLKKQFKQGSQYFSLKNYRYETVFHIAAKGNSLESLKYICGRAVWIDQMLKRDFEGNTPLHTAAKAGSYDTLKWFLEHVTPNFCEI